MQEDRNNPTNDQILTDVEKLLFIVKKGLEVQKLCCIYEELSRIDNFENNEKAILMRNAISDEIVIIWNDIFGNKRNQTHFKKVASRMRFPCDEARNIIIRAMNINDGQYKVMHQELLNWRNKLVAHIDIDYVFENEMRLEIKYYKLIRLQFASIASFILDFLLEYLSEKRDLYCSYRLKNGESRRRCAYDLINDIKREWENQINYVEETFRNYN